MADLTGQARDMAAAIEAKKAEAAAKWADFDALRKSAVSEGVDFASNAEAFDKLDAASKAYDTVRDEVAAMEAKRSRLLEMVATEGARPEERKAAAQQLAATLGERFTKSAVYQELKASGVLDIEAEAVRTPGIKMATGAELKTLLSTSDGGSALWRNDRIGLLVPTVQPALNVLDVIPTATTSSDVVEWVSESTFTNAAAETNESTNATAASSPESTVAFTTNTTNVREITHFIPVTKKQLQDGEQTEAWVNQRLVYGIRKRLQSQLVSGNGTAPNLRGMVNVVGIQTQARGTDSRADAVHKAITKIRINAESDAEAQFIGLHPTDLETLRLEKTVGGDYVYSGGPVGNGAGTIWGLTPVVSTAFSQGTAVVFDPSVMSLFYHTSGLTVSMSDSHSTYFVERKIAMLASLRAAFAVWQPNGVCTVTSF